jgi:hypothetical protein
MADGSIQRRGNGRGRGGPARGYSWAPFEAGHRLSTKHGAYSSVAIGPRASEIADELRAELVIYTAADEPVVRLLALTLARIERASEALDRVDEETSGEGLAAYASESAPALQRLREDCRGWINTARRLANDLGMTPTSRAKLGLDLVRTGDALDRLAADGREARERAERRMEEGS